MSENPDGGPGGEERRSFLSRVSGVAMIGGLVSGYGAFVHIAGRFLYPARKPEARWLYVARVADVAPGTALAFQTPGGSRITVARRGDDFIALSSICPHLGCQVRWEAQHERFFCPCHNGVFDATGKGTGGPPKDADQSLSTFPLKVDRGLLYIGLTEEVAELDDDVLREDSRDAPPGPGHDPCLFERPRCDGEWRV
ncbi:MAG: hypothetical protein CMJ83_05975 [Planctomycetes bacterium]|nr:hypothetical protein [Planctomycetota bacterium]